MTHRDDHDHRFGACEQCDGTGWTTVTQVELGNPKSYSWITPCRCTTGQRQRKDYA
jgi:hypothetical protein